MVCEGITAVIVDDEPDVRLLMRLVLESSGSNCIVIGEAASGSEAIELIDLHPDCFVLDVMMPGMDGIETADRIRAVAPDQKVVFCSAHFDHGERPLPQCDAFVSKQDVDQLPAVLKSVVSCC